MTHPIGQDTPAEETIVDDLLEYAGNPGYSHNDYADVMRAAAAQIKSDAGFIEALNMAGGMDAVRIAELERQLADAATENTRLNKSLNRVMFMDAMGELAETKQDAGWISVAQLPDKDEILCVVLDPENEPTVFPAKWNVGSQCFDTAYGWFGNGDVTHWMPLPSAPAKEPT